MEKLFPCKAHPYTGLRYFFKSLDETGREWSALYQVARYIGYFFDNPSKPKLTPFNNSLPKSMFYDFTEQDWLIMRYTIEQLINEAQGKQLIIYTATAPVDFMRYEGKLAPLSVKLQALTQELNFIYVDMLTPMHQQNKDYSKYFFTCDNHWNSYANKVAAELLEPYVQKSLLK